MIHINKFKRGLESVIQEMEERKIRKVRSIALHKVQRKNSKINRSFLKELLQYVVELQKTKPKMTMMDLPKNEARFLFQDIMEGTMMIDQKNHELVIGVRL